MGSGKFVYRDSFSESPTRGRNIAMTPFQLACFISVESHLSFTKAAEDCHVAQATISRQITMLEEELGCKLFDRDSHGVQPTSAGATLAHYAPVFLEYQRNISEQVRNAVTHSARNLRIGVGPYEHLLLRQPLCKLHQEHPSIGIDLSGYTYHVLLTRYRNKVLDLALCNDLCAASMTEYTAHELCQVNWHVAASVNSPLWSLSHEQQQSLAGQTLITLVNDQYDGVRRYCYDRFISMRMVETNFLSTMLEQLQAGMGVAILPPFVAGMLPPGVVMRDILDVPHTQKFYAMLSPSLSPEYTSLLLRILSDALGPEKSLEPSTL